MTEQGKPAPCSGEGREDTPSASRSLPSGSADAKQDLIALIGPRGSGKTTVARLLAESLGWDWIDADDVLERRVGRSIRALFAEAGEAAFREHESAILREFCGLRRHVLATGGGVILRDDNRSLLKASARVVWLNADAETLWRRLQSDSLSAERRPTLLSGGREEVEEIMRIREPLYRACADRIVHTAGRTPEEVAAEIAAIRSDLAPTPKPPRE